MSKKHMNLQDYKLKRISEQAKLDKEYSSHRILCYRCFRSKKSCLCSDIIPFPTFFEFRILMHPMEAKKERTGTGRLTNLALNKSKIIIGENFDDSNPVQKIINSLEYYPMLLYPGVDSINISTTNLPTQIYTSQKKKPLIFVIDGTWPCAKSMMRESKSLHNLPRISFDPSIQSKFHIKQQPKKYCLSTIESVYQLISELEKQGIENTGSKKEVLPALLKRLVDFQIKCAGDTSLVSYKRKSRPYKKPQDRIENKKWKRRKICF